VIVGDDVSMSQSSAGPAGSQDSAVIGSDDGEQVPGPGSSDHSSDPMHLVWQPAKVMRIGTMVKQLLEEVRAAPLDEASRKRLKEIYESSIMELADGLDPELTAELHRLALPFGDGTPTEGELRIAQAQLVGWLEGLFHGIQATLFAQQMAARSQLEQIRRAALPPGASAGMPPEPQQMSGPYL
jgi:hypothetical protein